MDKKEILAQVICRTGITALARYWNAGQSDGLRILAYHRVLDRLPSEDYKFDRELISATTEEFEWQIAHIKRYYQPITFGELERRLRKGENLENAVIVTFDDGFDDNYYKVYPILKKYDVPATIFISTDYIGGFAPFWFEWLIYMGNQLNLEKIAALAEIDWDEHWSAPEARCAILRNVKKMKNQDRLILLDQLDELLGENVSRVGYAESHPMNWDHVREMSDNGIEFGSHTKSHPILSSLTKEQKIEELVGSKAIIERETGQQCIAIAYPVGGRDQYDDETIQEAIKAGYRFGLTYIHGRSKLNDANLFELHRLHVERYTTRARFSAMMALPAIFSY
jgi:peptidoglycan/xylan/chitin deacetylase (PgdA/CDA1 family)